MVSLLRRVTKFITLLCVGVKMVLWEKGYVVCSVPPLGRLWNFQIRWPHMRNCVLRCLHIRFPKQSIAGRYGTLGPLLSKMTMNCLLTIIADGVTHCVKFLNGIMCLQSQGCWVNILIASIIHVPSIWSLLTKLILLLKLLIVLLNGSLSNVPILKQPLVCV